MKTVCVCPFSNHICSGEVIGYISSMNPNPQGRGPLKLGHGVRTAQTVHFWGNFMKQKLKCTPENGRGETGQVRSTQVSGGTSKSKGGFCRHSP